MITKLFESIFIAPVPLANRMIRTVMHLNYALSGHVTDKFLEFYRASSTWRCGIDRHRSSGYQLRVIRHGFQAFHQEG